MRGQDCGVLWADNGAINAKPCERKLSFVCEGKLEKNSCSLTLFQKYGLTFQDLEYKLLQYLKSLKHENIFIYICLMNTQMRV